MFEGKEALFEYFLVTDELFSSFNPLLWKMQKYMNPGEKTLMSWAGDFKMKFKRMPTLKELELQRGALKLQEPYDDKVMYAETLSFIKNERVKEWVVDVADKLDTGAVKVEELFSNTRSMVDDFVGREFRIKTFSDVSEGVIKDMVSPMAVEKVPTGIKGLDKVLVGGFGKGEFACIIAPPGRGKTMSLINMAYGALVARKKVLFITLELSEEQILGRFVRRIGRQSRKDIRLDVKKIKDMISRFTGVAGDLVVVYGRPHVFSIDELRIMAERVQRKCNGLDLIVIDYFDRMALPHRDARLGYGFLVDYMRDMCMEKKLAILSATQANRQSLTATVVTEEHVGESFKKVENSDVVLSINRSAQDVNKNAGRYVIIKNREWGGMGGQVPVSIDWEKSFIGDFGS